jgi:hypothetical protein
LIKQVNKILGIRNSEIWLFDDVSKINDPASNNAGMKIRTIVSKEKEKIAQLGKQAPKKE